MTAAPGAEVLWAPAAAPGIEHLRLHSPPGGGPRAESLVVAVDEDAGPAGRPFRVRYTVVCDARWRVRTLDVAVDGPERGAAALHLTGDGAGRWTAAGVSRPDLDGCLDVDLTVSPFTNTLPVRRLGLAPGQAAEIRVAYVELPRLRLSVAPQRYTCLAAGPLGSRYRFESLDADFTADLTLDAAGLVVEYPGLFRRVGAWPD